MIVRPPFVLSEVEGRAASAAPWGTHFDKLSANGSFTLAPPYSIFAMRWIMPASATAITENRVAPTT